MLFYKGSCFLLVLLYKDFMHIKFKTNNILDFVFVILCKIK